MKEIINCVDCISNELIQIEIDDNFEVSRKRIDVKSEETIYVAPGLLDIQINGFSGVDFNTFPIIENDFLKVINSLSKEGVLSFFPTIITNSDINIINLLKNINKLCLKNSLIESYVSGIHLEGPFISPVKEASGAHSKNYIKAPDWELFEVFQEASGNRIKIVTISPEWDNSIEFITKCVANNIIVSIGHTVASNGQIDAAVRAGAKMSTHLGNGAPLSLHRNSNIIFDQLANNYLIPSVIADGFHLPDNFLKIVIQVKKKHVILVSDSTMFAGMEAGVYHSHIGGKVKLEKEGKLSTYKNENVLAGSAVSLLHCVNKLFSSGIVSLTEAWSFASIQPRELVGLSDTNNDFILFKLKDNSIHILSVYKSGKQIYINSEI
ncbi:hypothetical protein APS56_06345 [Pseudalgibacter alginicilyticus]|uniref:N-acetylglucosamine-6-phosphate deacetylase n=1 Tax=Pseudalgibacter alginicilyticus TaxID=1736674 RepID=A0A0N7HYB2_9FLAO|nr:hypothetical protein [Pseudalgibacter alginicilyticus]ALJ04766.1 hypothetical protein APS56_06345 [Pseudalgibacter alginicilyticus]